MIYFGGNLAVVYAVAFGLSVGAVLFNSADNSTLPALVSDQALVAASSGIWTAAVLSQIALAPLAAVLYATLGPGPAFGVNGASFLVSAAVLTGLRLPAALPAASGGRGFFADARAGMTLLAGTGCSGH